MGRITSGILPPDSKKRQSRQVWLAGKNQSAPAQGVPPEPLLQPVSKGLGSKYTEAPFDLPHSLALTDTRTVRTAV